MVDLTVELIKLIYSQPGLTGRQYTRILNNNHNSLDKSSINHILYSRHDIFIPNPDEWSVPAWTLSNFGLLQYRRIVSGSQPEEQSKDVYEPFKGYTGPKPYVWQLNAYRSWKNANYQGVISAVTGSGKSLVALMAIEEHLLQGWKVAILVPSLVLQKQWFENINKGINIKRKYTIGMMNGDQTVSLTSCNILIATAQSACKWVMNNGVSRALLIADECHHFGAETWATALETSFQRRMGLTATYERNDTGIKDYLDPYFKREVYNLGYTEALEQGVICPFEVNFVCVQLSAQEREVYESADEKCKKLRTTLINQYGVPAEPFGAFMKAVTNLKKSGEEAPYPASRYITNFNRRRDSIADVLEKSTKLEELAQIIKSSGRTIVFTQTIKGAIDSTSVLEKCGIKCRYLTSDMKMSERESILESFRRGAIQVIAAPQLMDEGIDIPVADLAIVIAASRTKRHMIQRMGRVLRKKEDGKKAKIYILYAKDTYEDPDNGAHETFIGMLTEASDSVNYERCQETQKYQIRVYPDGKVRLIFKDQ